MPTLDRRTFLKHSAIATGGALGVVPVGEWGRRAVVDESLAPFLHGVASGDPLADGVMIWTRVDPGADRTRSITVSWMVATDPQLTAVVQRGTARAVPERNWCVKVDVRGLDAGRTYYYGFTSSGRSSLTGRTKTAPAAGADHLRFAVVSCSNLPAGYFNAYARIAEREDLDAVIHLGDYLYESGSKSEEIGRPADPLREIISLDDYRTRYSQYRLDADLRRLHQQYAFINVWDDHESANDSWYGGAGNHDPEDGDWFERKRAAAQAFDEWLPIRLPDQSGRSPEDATRVYRTLHYGDLADILMVDSRLERDQQVSGTPSFEAENDDPARSILGERQEAWLREELVASKERGTTWRLLGNGVMIGHWNAVGLPDTEHLTFIRGEGIALNGDQWDGYSASRKRLYEVLAGSNRLSAPIDDVVVLTGDLHISFALDLPPNPFITSYIPVTGAGSLAVEMVTPSITSTNFDDDTGAPSDGVEVLVLAANPHIKYAELDSNGYVILDVTRERVQGDWFHVDTVAVASDGEAFASAWKTNSGDNHLTPASAPSPAGASAEPAPAGPVSVPGSPGVDGTSGRGPGVLPATGQRASLWAVAAAAAAGAAIRLRLRGHPGRAERP